MAEQARLQERSHRSEAPRGRRLPSAFSAILVVFVLTEAAALMVAQSRQGAPAQPPPTGGRQNYVPSGPPLRIGFQGASQPFFFTTTWFCDAVYQWERNLAAYAEDADVRLGVLANPNNENETSPLAQTVWSGKPRGGVTFTTPPCASGTDTIRLSIIGKLPIANGAFGRGALQAIGPAVFVRKITTQESRVVESSQWFCKTECNEERITFSGNRFRSEGRITACNGNPPGPTYTEESTWRLGTAPSGRLPPGTAVCSDKSEVPCDTSLAFIAGELTIIGGSCRKER